MIEVAESRHVRTANELMLIVPVKAGFVDGADRLVSYSTRLTWILSALAEDLRQAAEETLVGNTSRIERLNTIFNTQWAVRERPAGAELLVSAVFDRSWEDYFHLLVDRTGPMLDLIFCHCEGVEGRTCRDGYEAFADFIRSYQVQTRFFHSELRDLTVDDLRIVRYFGDTSPEHGPLPSLQVQAQAALQRVIARRGAAAVSQDLQLRAANAVTSLWEMRSYFPEVVENRGSPTALEVYDNAAVQLLEPQRTLLADPNLNIPDAARAWVKKMQEPAAPPASSQQRVELSRSDLENIQGNILLPYDGVLEGDLVLLQCETPKQRAQLLEHLAKVVHSQAEELAGANAMRVNVALTYTGLARLGLDASMLSALPLEFRQGMESRSAIIGDVGEPNHPQYWQRPKLGNAAAIDLGSVDMVVTLQGGDASARASEIDVLQRLGAVVLHQQPLRRKQRNGELVDAFGFLDPGNANTGSQPVANASLMGRDLTRPASAGDVVELGELVLGYPDARGEIARCADPERDAACAEIFRQGSFVVLRKLEQHVAAMKAFLSANNDDSRAVDEVLGRDGQGKPLADKEAPNNEFTYDKDPKGRSCPLHAHIRLSNPRSSANDEQRVPRIMRRGFSYKNSEDDQGLMFMAYGANIASQFEVIQRWLNGGNSTGIFSHHNDVISGTPLWEGAVQPDAWKAPPQRLVSLRWGMYLFVPGRAALRKLAQIAQTPSAAAGRVSPQGRQLLIELDAVQDPARALHAWKQLMEAEEWRPSAAQVWSVIRAQRAPRRTPYGWLVGDVDNARAVLCDDGRNFSVREYWSRLGDTIGEHYLGLDDRGGKLAGSRCPRDTRFEQRQEQVSHQRAGERPNRYLYEQLQPDQAFDKALSLSYSVLAEQKGQVDIRVFVAAVVGLLAKEWIGVPTQDALELVQYMQCFTLVSRFAFQPYPDDMLRRQALAAGAFLRKGYAKDDLTDPMSVFMRELRPSSQLSDDAIRVARMGAIVGFAPPTIGNLVSVISRWRSNGELMRQAQLARQRPDSFSKRQGIEQPLLAALRDAPVPPTLYRTVVTPWGDAQPGEIVVVGLQSTWIDAELRGYSEPWQWLFGGAHAASSGGQVVGSIGTLHGCPGRLPAFAAMCGIMAALADCGSFQWIGPYVMRVDPSQLAAAQSARYRGISNGRRQRSSTVPPPV